MLAHRYALKAPTAICLVLSMSWMGSGGQAWADSLAVQRDPALQVARWADDPRLALSSSERDFLRASARKLSSPPAPTLRQAPARSHSERRSVVGLAALGEQAESLATSALEAAAAGSSSSPGEILGTVHSAARDLRRSLTDLDRGILADFRAVEARLRGAGMPQQILDRHAEALAGYQAHMAEVLSHVDRAASAQEPGTAEQALGAAADLLRTSTDERPHQAWDPSRLPFQVAEAKKQLPRLPPTPGIQSMSAADLGLSGRFLADQAPPTAADLQPTEDVQITPEIQALAASLDGAPVALYSWVHDNVRFVPTHGSVQGSQMTLESLRGNAYDTASLLIALLRASGIPARYGRGTVEVPVAKVQNWVGGAATPRVAQQVLGQGGVPNVGLISGGAVTQIRIEHVWVEAFVDNVPSRGALHQEGDTWLALDPSFKQHEFTPPSSFFEDNPIEPVLEGPPLFDVDETLGRVVNVNDDALDERLLLWGEEADLYLTANGIPRTTEGVIGGQTIVSLEISVLPSSLPYSVLTRQPAVSALPASLRHTVTLKGFANEFDRSFGAAAFSVEVSLPSLNSRRLGIQFDPATDADAMVLDNARNGGASSLPVYLVRVLPRVKLDGVTIATGGSVGMGRSYFLDVVLGGPDGPTTVPYRVVAGDEIVVGVTGNGVAQEVVERRFAANPVDNAPEYLHQVQLHYWAQNDLMAEVAAGSLGVHPLRLPSVGLFSSPLTVSLLFGSPRSGIYQSRIMDVQRSLIGAAGEDPAKVTAFVKQSGMAGSFLEGSVFDQLENDLAGPLKGISAVHLLSAAMAQGIPVYRITPANAAAAVPQLALSSAVERDITTALAQGKTVMAPERELTVGPWRGAGYILQDETTGAGAYLISGGLAGGGLLDCLEELVPRWVLVLAVIIAIILLIVLLWWLAGLLAPVLAGAGAAAAEAWAFFLLILRGLAPLALA